MRNRLCQDIQLRVTATSRRYDRLQRLKAAVNVFASTLFGFDVSLAYSQQLQQAIYKMYGPGVLQALVLESDQ